MKTRILLILLFVITLGGCGEDAPQEETKSVDWYKANDTERTAKLKECNNNPGELRLTPNCINAQQAEKLAVSKPADFKW